uniref:Sulfotransferase n=1 Tax=Kalanchoe fedtschenkoi TaxID=63787 RepID=A0A7N0ULG9_KALFE
YIALNNQPDKQLTLILRSSSGNRMAAYIGDGEADSQEVDSLIESLPKIPFLRKFHCYKYDGFWYRENHLRAVLSCKKHFRFQDSDILLTSFPKCGTTWLKSILYTIINRLRNPIGSEDHPLLTNSPHTLVRGFENDLYANNAIPDLSNMHAPRLFQLMHQLYHFVMRNHKDCFNSFWHFLNKLKSLEASTVSLDEFFDSFCSGRNAYGPFWDHVVRHWNVSLAMPGKLMFLSYEQIIEQPDHYVKKMAEFMGCPFSRVEEDEGVVSGIVKMCSFTHLSQLEANKSGRTKSGADHCAFFRQGEVGDSKNLLSSEMIKRIDQIAQNNFSPYGLKI